MKRLLLVLILILATSRATAQTAVVTRSVNLRTGPAKSYAIKETLHLNDELLILDPNQSNGYYNVRVADGEAGWTWGKNIRITDTAPPPSNNGQPPEVFHGCPLEGTAVSPHRQQSNELKNRRNTPGTGDIDQNATVAALLQDRDDRTVWNDTHGASIVAYVVNVKLGSKETVNCGDTDSAYIDTHIEVLQNTSDTGKTARLIVEVTPRWRWFVAQQGEDWSTRALKQSLQGHWVRFTGWLFWDFEHADEAEHTNPGHAGNWRATAWEIHPITDIKICPGSPQTCD
ncbi:MAG TPA: hypothetical protein VGU74_06115 [Gemmatimonadales bacterium]|nr:hypothetical protein [Gemmatimonadales bacterium]